MCNSKGISESLFINGKNYTFTSYNGSKLVKIEEKENYIELAVSRKNTLLEISLEKNTDTANSA